VMRTIRNIIRHFDPATIAIAIAALAFIGWRSAGSRGSISVDAQRAAALVETLSGVTTTLGGTRRVPGDAKAAVVEFSDYQCPFCGEFARNVFPSVESNFVQTGKLGYALRHLPIERAHPNALPAAEAAECAGRQGRRWEMHHLLFQDQRLDADSLRRDAEALHLEMSAFSACEHGAAIATIRADQEEARRLTVKATPTFLIGVITSDGSLDVKRRINGAVPYQVFKQAIEEVLALR
jgi:protein-disulfide isomerase